MKRSRVKLALLAALAVTFVAGMAPSQASAFVSYYNCVNKPHNLWCDGRANGSFDGLNSWDYSEGWNPGAGSFGVCQQVWRPATGGLLGASCATNWTGYYYGDVQCNCYEANVKQTSGSAKSINGYADSAW